MVKKFKSIGVMSGTSLDGIDVAACEFKFENKQWQFDFIAGKTYAYTDAMYQKLKNAPILSGFDLAALDVQYGKEIGRVVNSFMKHVNYKPDFIASHGYTVFHQPENTLTLQIGSGAQIAALTGAKTVCDFRTIDVALGGNGAPLVPIGDELLFGHYTACLNLGGFSNISYRENNIRVAYDICPTNIMLNYITQRMGNRYDENGRFGRTGKVNTKLLKSLNNLPFYKKSGPRSLGAEFLHEQIVPLLSKKMEIKDVLRTAYEHITEKIANAINGLESGNVLVTGGGTYNNFLMELLRNKLRLDLIIPDENLIDFKEAILFAFLGALRITNSPNCLSSVTGASLDNIGGAVYSGAV